MKKLPQTENPLVLRTDFSNQTAWDSIRGIMEERVGEDGFLANVTFLEDRSYDGIPKSELIKLVPEEYDHSFIVVVDHTAVSRHDNAVLIVDLYDEPGREFRALPSTVQSIENNLSIANMEFEEFADAADESGIFHGF